MIMANKDNSGKEALKNLLGTKITIQPPTIQKEEKHDENGHFGSVGHDAVLHSQ